MVGAEAGRTRGIVLGTVGGLYTIELDDGRTVEASLRGRLKREKRTASRIAPGDRVQLQVHDGGGHTIEAVGTRENALARRAPGRRTRRAQVIVANVDLMAAVIAAAQPEPNPRMLDRFLVLAEANGLDALIIINKLDLLDDPGTARERFRVYERVGYPVLYISVKERNGLEAVRTRLCDGTSVLAGPSGAGKSSLLNAIEAGLARRVGEVGRRAGSGRHTTVAAELVPLECGGYVADTPGLNEIGLWGLSLEELPACFPEFQPYLARCRFGYSCTHTHEPGCVVRDAVEAAEIDPDRYESYLAIRESEAGEAWRNP